MIKIQQLVKAFGSRIILSKINLEIAPGEFITLIGRNGAGKTTLLNIISTLSKPTSGIVTINDLDIHQHANHIRSYIGVVSHKPLLYDDLTGLENLRFYAKIYDVENAKSRIETVLHQVGLFKRGDDLVRTYSRGMQQRLAIARAVLHNPPILLLDEPDTGLDQQANHMLTDLLTIVGMEQRTVLMTSHNLQRSLALGKRILILKRGKIAYDKIREDVTIEEVEEIAIT